MASTETLTQVEHREASKLISSLIDLAKDELAEIRRQPHADPKLLGLATRHVEQLMSALRGIQTATGICNEVHQHKRNGHS